MTGKYETLHNDIYSIWASANWSNENIKTFPENFIGQVPNKEYIRVSILPSDRSMDTSYQHLGSVSGQVMIDIFVPAGKGPIRASQIADRLDAYLVGKSVQSGQGLTQFQTSTLSNFGFDKANASLFRAIYTIPFTYFGV